MLVVMSRCNASESLIIRTDSMAIFQEEFENRFVSDMHGMHRGYYTDIISLSRQNRNKNRNCHICLSCLAWNGARVETETRSIRK